MQIIITFCVITGAVVPEKKFTLNLSIKIQTIEGNLTGN